MPSAQTKKGIYPMEKEITVQELIDQLNKIENKNIPVDIVLLDLGPVKLDAGDHIEFQELVFNTSHPSEKIVSVSIGSNGYKREFHESFDYFKSVAESTDPETIAMIERKTKVFDGDRKKPIASIDEDIIFAYEYVHKYGSSEAKQSNEENKEN